MRIRGASLAFGVLGILVQSEVVAQYRVAIEPAIDVTQVHDDNLFFSAASPAHDLILRVTPTLALRVESPRWSVGGAYGFDSERFANHSGLTNSRARQRGSVRFGYRPGPRLSLALEGGYTDTDTPAELNIDTGLAASRARLRQLTFGPSVNLRISPRLSARAAYLSTTQTLRAGGGMRSQLQTVGVEQRVTPRDLFTADGEHGTYAFDVLGGTSRVNTFVLRGGWTHLIDARTSITFQAGPRMTDHSAAPEFAGSFAHAWKSSSIAISGLQTQTTVIGSAGTVNARGLEARFTFNPTPSLRAYATPGFVRSAHDDLQATVYRIGVGANYAITPLAGIDVAYNLVSQHGAVDALRAYDGISRSVLSVRFTTHWTTPDWFGTGRR